MVTLAWTSLILAFLAPIPPMQEWPEKHRHPARGSVNWLVLFLCGGFALLFAASPIAAAISASRAYDAFRVRCEATGGTLLHVWHGGHPYTCDQNRAAPG